MCLFVFFQAEDGIRDLVRSRGLGDVYKRQDVDAAGQVGDAVDVLHAGLPAGVLGGEEDTTSLTPALDASSTPVSYTHLTLPTSDLV